MQLSIVLGTYNRLPHLKDCVESIFDQTSVAFRLYVTDAGSTDGTIEYLRLLAGDVVHPIFAGRKMGQARAYNEVFERVDTPYVCWLSDDNVVVNRGLEVAVEILEANRRFGMVGLKTRDICGPFQKAAYIGGISPIGVLNVNQGMLPTPVLKQVKGFGEVFRDYGIDPDLTAKVILSGYDIAYTRTIALHHQRNWSSDPAELEYQALRQKQKHGEALYLRKYAGLAGRSPMWRTKRAVLALLRCSVRFSFRLPLGRFLHALESSLAGAQHGARKRDRGKRTRWVAAALLCRPLVVFARCFVRLRVRARTYWDKRERKLCGLPPRDWSNILQGRFISLLDPARTRGKPYHLVQHCPARLRPTVLPADPVDDHPDQDLDERTFAEWQRKSL